MRKLYQIMTITTQIQNKIATLTLNRPEVFNSFNRKMAFLLQEQLDICQRRSDVRAIILTGSGKAFSAGQDLKEVSIPALNPGFKKILEEHYNPILTRIRKIEKPIIAAVNGVAAGAGANIALACDVVIASEDACFIQAFSKIGLVPDCAGTYFLPRLIGFQKASALMMLGDKISAVEAERIGMIYKVVSKENFLQEVEIIATKLSKMSTKAIGLTKRLLNDSMCNSFERQLNLECHVHFESALCEDFEEGLNAFVNKRKPNFEAKYLLVNDHEGKYSENF